MIKFILRFRVAGRDSLGIRPSRAGPDLIAIGPAARDVLPSLLAMAFENLYGPGKIWWRLFAYNKYNHPITIAHGIVELEGREELEDVELAQITTNIFEEA